MTVPLPHAGGRPRRGRAAAAPAAASLLLLLLLALALAARLVQPAAAAGDNDGKQWGDAGGGWKQGRATFYGDEPWAWDIHHGSCGRGYLWPDYETGWDVAALADTHPEYGGSCGACFEVQCSPGGIKDGYGASLDRSGVCRGGSVVVRITDTCPCHYPGNYYSNKRWCCGPTAHFDLSVWAFEQLADRKWGVVPIRYRRVGCSDTAQRKPRGASGTPGVFPPVWRGKQRKDQLDWWRWFPNGGWTNRDDGRTDMISTHDYLKKIGKA